MPRLRKRGVNVTQGILFFLLVIGIQHKKYNDYHSNENEGNYNTTAHR